MKNDSAFPNQALGKDGLPSHEPYFGLTKIELISAMALQGLLSNLMQLRKAGFKDCELEEFAYLRARNLIKFMESGNK